MSKQTTGELIRTTLYLDGEHVYESVAFEHAHWGIHPCRGSGWLGTGARCWSSPLGSGDRKVEVEDERPFYVLRTMEDVALFEDVSKLMTLDMMRRVTAESKDSAWDVDEEDLASLKRRVAGDDAESATSASFAGLRKLGLWSGTWAEYEEWVEWVVSGPPMRSPWEQPDPDVDRWVQALTNLMSDGYVGVAFADEAEFCGESTRYGMVVFDPESIVGTV